MCVQGFRNNNISTKKHLSYAGLKTAYRVRTTNCRTIIVTSGDHIYVIVGITSCMLIKMYMFYSASNSGIRYNVYGSHFKKTGNVPEGALRNFEKHLSKRVFNNLRILRENNTNRSYASRDSQTSFLSCCSNALNTY